MPSHPGGKRAARTRLPRAGVFRRAPGREPPRAPYLASSTLHPASTSLATLSLATVRPTVQYSPSLLSRRAAPAFLGNSNLTQSLPLLSLTTFAARSVFVVFMSRTIRQVVSVHKRKSRKC
jgi:hypothetical protein